MIEIVPIAGEAASQWAAVFLLGATPVFELRGAIPLGILVYGFPAWAVFVVAVIGNMVPAVLIYLIGDAWIRWTRARQGMLRRLTDRVLARAERKFNDRFAVYGMIALPLFVAIPLPFTGAVTGTLGAFLLGIPFSRAFPLVGIGVVTAGIIVTLAVTGAVHVFSLFI